MTDLAKVKKAIEIYPHISRVSLLDLDIPARIRRKLLSLGYNTVGDVLIAGEFELHGALKSEDIWRIRIALEKIGVALFPNGVQS